MAAANIRHRGIDLLVRPERHEASLWRRYAQSQSSESQQHLFDYYQPLAKAIAAKQFAKRKAGTCEFGDVEQLAYEGMLQAIKRFDPELGTPFSAYCRRRIVGNINTGLEGTTERSAQYSYQRRVERDRLKSLANAPEGSDDPIASLSQLTALLAIGLLVEDSIPVDPDELASNEPSAYESLAWREMQRNLQSTIAKLDDRSGYVIKQHYVQGVSFKQIAKVVGVTKGRISQIHRAALLRLRELMGRYR